MRVRRSFSAVSKPKFAIKYALESSRRDLHKALLCTVLNAQNFRQKSLKILRIFSPNFAKFQDQDQDQDLSGIEKRVFENSLEREDVARFPFLTPQPSAH